MYSGDVNGQGSAKEDEKSHPEIVLCEWIERLMVKSIGFEW